MSRLVANSSMVSGTGVTHAFELKLDDCIDSLIEAIDALSKAPDFENGTNVCLATRVAWAVYYSDWRLAGGCPAHLTDRLKDALVRGSAAVASAASVVDSKDDREFLRLYPESIAFRSRCLDVLLARGAEAVMSLVEERAAEFRRTGFPTRG